LNFDLLERDKFGDGEIWNNAPAVVVVGAHRGHAVTDWGVAFGIHRLVNLVAANFANVAGDVDQWLDFGHPHDHRFNVDERSDQICFHRAKGDHLFLVVLAWDNNNFTIFGLKKYFCGKKMILMKL
jgi:hypothetical protein